MTYRQLLADIGLAVLLAAPTLTLAKPNAAGPTSPTVADELSAPVPLAQAAQRAADRRG